MEEREQKIIQGMETWDKYPSHELVRFAKLRMANAGVALEAMSQLKGGQKMLFKTDNGNVKNWLDEVEGIRRVIVKRVNEEMKKNG